MEKKILIIDDDRIFLKITQAFLVQNHWKVVAKTSWDEARSIYEAEEFPLLLVDLNIGGQSGLQVIEEIKKINPEQGIVIITGHSSVETAISALRMGVADYITKPCENEEIAIRLENLYSLYSKDQEIKELKDKIAEVAEQGEILTQDKKMYRLLDILKTVSMTDATILLLGETGTGKELFARKIHRSSSRRNNPFMVVNCAGLNENLLESHLFGHSKGSFTGAHENVKGKFEAVGEGTIFLDEISETSLNFQKKLLRVLQERTFERIGESRSRECYARIIAASNRNLKEMVVEGRFREDLFFRLNVVPLTIPPLRERVEDIPLLAKYFIEKYSKKYQKPIKEPPPSFFGRLMNCSSWPGNVRELEHYLEKLVVTSVDQKLLIEDFPLPSEGEVEENDSNLDALLGLSYDIFSQQTDQLYFQRLLDLCHGDISKVSEMAGTAKKTVYAKIKKYDLNWK